MSASVGLRRRALLSATAVTLGLVLLFAATAFAHDISGIDATCDTLTVHFHDFASNPVNVHIVVNVGDAPAIVKDVPVDVDVTSTEIDISSAT